MEQILTILEQLISFRSITPSGKDAIEYISTILQEHNFKSDIQTFGEGEEETTNLYAVFGEGKFNICFAGHIDVVPPGNEADWTYDPFKMHIDDQKVFGRGAVDMKGAIASALVAVINFLKKYPKPQGTISFLITTDEEGSGKYGTKEMLKYITDKYSPITFCILGEPTSENQICDTIKIGRRGSINFVLKVSGQQGHVAYPEKAVNPIPIMNDIVSELLSLKLDDSLNFFQPSNLEFTSIDSGNYISNIIPETITTRFNIRFNNLHTADSLVAKMHEIINQYTTNYELTYHSPAEAFIQDFCEEIKHITSIVEKVTGIKPELGTGGGTSDARFIHQYAQVVEIGLNSSQAHKIDEHTEIRDLQTLYNVYYTFLTEFLGLALKTTVL